MRDTIIQISYLAASVCFILGLRSLTKPELARNGVRLAAIGMVLAVVGTLANHQIIDYRWIAGGLVLGTVIGYPLGMYVPMTAMPQRIALSLTFSALAASLVGIAEYYTQLHGGTSDLTRAKTAALKDLAAKTIDGTVPSGRALIRMSDDEIVARLTTVRGIGRWTVEMLLLFDLGRPDVWPVDDYGVRKGFAKTFGKRKLPTPKQLMKLGEKWRPYRSVAAWYFWRALDTANRLQG